jgi:non-ribosomal peptide synthase protein (TIGR01720 family)
MEDLYNLPDFPVGFRPSSSSTRKNLTTEQVFSPLPIHLHCLAIPDTEPHIFNLNSLWEVHAPFDSQIAQAALHALLKHHDALRSRFIYTAAGWKMYLADLDETLPFSHIDLSKASRDQQSALIEALIEKLQSTLDLSEGPLMRLVYFHLGNSRPGRLLFLLHHFVCDAFSWSILSEDFFSAYRQISEGGPPTFPPKTTSITDYATHLAAYVQSITLFEEAGYWLTDQRLQSAPLPIDYPVGSLVPTIKGRIIVKLSEKETHPLLSLARYNISAREVLLAALFKTFTQWTGEKCILVELINHGRISAFKDIDLSRTVGWMNNLVPFLVDGGPSSHLSEMPYLIKEQLLQIPNQGLGYGVLRYLSSGHIRQQFLAHPQPQLFLNYMGRVPSNRTDQSVLLLKPASECIKNTQSKHRLDPVRIWLTAGIVDSCLSLMWEYQENLYKKATLERLIQNFVGTLQDILHAFSL